jgi:hypothetical protein
LYATLEVAHAEVDIGQKINFVDDQRVHAAIGARVFVGLVIAFGDYSTSIDSSENSSPLMIFAPTP